MTDQTTPLAAQQKKAGFFYGYIIVIASFATMLVVYGAQYSFGVFFKPLLADFGWSRATTSGAYSLYFVFQGVSGIFAGRLSDRYGPRIVVTTCGFLLGMGYILLSRVQAIWHIYLFYGVFVAAGACIYVPIMSTVARWFYRRRGLMTGVISAGTGLGLTVVPPIANQLIISYSWRGSYTILGVVALVVTAGAAQFLKRDPAQIRQVAYGMVAGKLGTESSSLWGVSLWEALRTRQLWLICSIIFLGQFCIQTVLVHIVPHATDVGIPAVIAASILSIIGALSIAGKLSMGNGVDKLGSKRVMLLSLTLFSIGFIWIVVATAPWMLYLFTGIFAIAYGGYAAVHSPMTAEYFGLRHHGTIFGVVVLMLTVGGSIGPMVAGRIFDATNSYSLAFILCAIASVISLLLLACLKPFPKDKLL